MEGGEKKFGPPATPEEENELILERSEYLLKHIAEQEEKHSIEALTQLKRREVFETELKIICGEREEKRHGVEPPKKVAIILLDLDHFKNINDTNGHAAGDEVLRKVADLLTHSVRPTDTVARYGGEELVMLMRDADLDVAMREAESLREKIEKLEFDAYPALKVTASFGVYSAEVSDRPSSKFLIEKADEALYAAKHAGRNRVESYVENDHEPIRTAGE